MPIVTDFDSVEIQTFPFTPPQFAAYSTIEAIAKGVALLHLRGTTDADYLRQHFFFVVPRDNAGDILYTKSYPYPSSAIAIAYPATVELDGPGILGWGIDSVKATTQPTTRPDGSPATQTTVDAYAVVRSKNVAFMRMGFLVIIIRPGYSTL